MSHEGKHSLLARPALACIRVSAGTLSVAGNSIVATIQDLRNSFTFVVVTDNLRQAACPSDYPAFFYLGELIEYDTTAKIFTHPAKKQAEDCVTGRFG